MQHIPVYIQIVFEASTVFTWLMLYMASGKSPLLTAVILFWLALQAAISLTGFYTVTTGMPPRFVLLLAPPVLAIIILFITKSGRAFAGRFNTTHLTLLQTVRIPVELTLYWLFIQKAVPQIMTFEGRNFDILCGLTAPFIWYFGYVKKTLGKNLLLAWNIICLLLLANIVIVAVLSAPFVFQKFGFGQPNIALFYFPFVWLPCCIVPAVLLAHVICIRDLLRKQN